jgi:hypothetical protein
MTTNIPEPFPGTEDEAAANRATHRFDSSLNRCWDCDCRPWGTYANYPCGAVVKRIDVPNDSPEANAAVNRMSLGAAVWAVFQGEDPT